MNDRTKGFTLGSMNTIMVLIIGGLGFMGSNLASRLVKEGAEVSNDKSIGRTGSVLHESVNLQTGLPFQFSRANQ
jgi:nucleoside-diphosphate-sugar epimerase